MNNKIWKKIETWLGLFNRYGGLLGLLGLGLAIGYILKQDIEWQNTGDYLKMIGFKNLVLGSGFFVIYLYMRSFAWVFMRKDKLKISNVKVWFGSELMRFIPGSIWSWMSRGVQMKNDGVSGKKSILYELGLTIVAAVLIGSWWYWWFGLVISLVGLLIVKKWFGRVGWSFGLLVLGWLCFGLAHYFWLGSEDWRVISGAGLAWLVGLVSFVPLGVGVRESVLAWLLGGGGGLLLLVMLIRVWQVLIEIGNYLILVGIVKFGRRLVGKQFVRILLGVMIIGYTVAISYWVILRHESFYSNFDLGNMDQTVWNTSQGRLFELTSGDLTVKRFAIHSDIVLVLLAPLYWIWSDVRMLLVFQVLFVSMGAVAVYLIALEVWKKEELGLALAVSYLVNPWILWTLFYDFHPVALAMPLLLAAFYCLMKKNVRWYWIWAILALFTKEQIGLWLMMMGVVWIILHRNWKQGIGSAAVGGGWFLGMVFGIMPFFTPSSEKHWAWGWYGIGEKTEVSNTGLVINVIDKIKSINGGELMDYVKELVFVWGYIPLLGLPWLILAAGDVGINMLSTHGQMRGMELHYDSGIVPALVIAIVFGVKWTSNLLGLVSRRKIVKKIGMYGLVGIVLVSSLRAGYFYGPTPITPSHWKWMFEPSEVDIRFEQVLQSIPSALSVSSSGNVRPHVTQRQRAHVFPSQAREADYVAILTEERIVGRVIDLEYEKNLVEELRNDPNYIVVFEEDKHLLFKRI